MRLLWRSTVVLSLGFAGFVLAFLLGWLKSLYYFDSFGVDLSLVDLSTIDYLLESWFVVQNLLFFVVLWWTILKSRLYWTAIFGIVYASIPIASHYAFAADGSVVGEWLIAYRHTLLKFLPFGLLAAIWLFARRRRALLREPRWTSNRTPVALLVVLSIAWGISTAKHSGSFDAQRAQRAPALHLSRVRLYPSDAVDRPPAASELYLLHAAPESFLVWDGTGFRYGTTPKIRVLVVPRETVESVELTRVQQLQPGGQYF